MTIWTTSATRQTSKEVDSAKVAKNQEEIKQSVDEEEVEQRGILTMFGPIDNQLTADIINKLMFLEAKLPRNSDVRLLINSPGGLVESSWALVDLIESIPLTIQTIALGEICSAAVDVFIAGDLRIMSQNTKAMIHDFSYGREGSYSELLAWRKYEEMEHIKGVEHYIKHSKYKNRKDVEKYLIQSHDNWMTPKEMKRHGLCDIILSTKAQRAKYEK